MRGFRKQSQIACILLAFLLVLTAGYASAQSFPSHTEFYPQTGGFDFPTQLQLFASLVVDANGIVQSATEGNFSDAAGHLASYNSTVGNLSASAHDAQSATVVAMQASQDNFASFIQDAQRYSVLYAAEASLPQGALRSNASAANINSMQELNGIIKTLHETLKYRNADIYGVAVSNGLDLSLYENTSALLSTYAAQMNSRLTNVTVAAFRTPTLTLSGANDTAVYGDSITLTGRLSDNQTGLSNSSVAFQVDNTTMAAVATTDASGSYTYQLPILSIPSGRHVAIAQYVPKGALYFPASSSKFNFSVAELPVTNTLRSFSLSVGTGSTLQAKGALMTPNGPVVNATVVLSLGGSKIAAGKTNKNGTYALKVPLTGIPFIIKFMPAVVSGTTGYTLFEPRGQALSSAESASMPLQVDLTMVYVFIGAAAAASALAGFLLYRRAYGRRVTRPVSGTASGEGRAPVEGPPAKMLVEPRVFDSNAVRDSARDLFRQKNDELATAALFDAAVTALSVRAHVRLATQMTYSEKSWALQAALPEARVALRELTKAYEIANYAERALVEPEREQAVSAFEALSKLFDGVEVPR